MPLNVLYQVLLLLQLDSTIKESQLHSTIGDFLMLKLLLTYFPNVAYATAPYMASKIGNQLWLAMYNRGYEAWTAWRTHDMPGFNLPAVSLLPVPQD
jgi:hypothetical protein